MKETKLKIVIHPIQAWGHINACLGLAETFHNRGHSVVFMVDTTLKGHFTKLGYGESLLYRKESKNSKDDSFIETAERYKKHFGLHVAEYHRKYGEEAFKDYDINMAITLEYDPQIEASLKTLQPDLIIVDAYYLPGSIVKSGIPFISNWSSNPLMLFNVLDIAEGKKRLPPYGSGFAADGSEKELWDADFETHAQVFKHYYEDQAKIFAASKVKPEQIPGELDVPTIYGFPKELDYTSVIPTPSNFFQIDSYCRKVEEKPLSIPDGFYNPESDKLIYFSFGTISSLDVPLMKRIMDYFSRLPYKFLVAKGPKSDEFCLPENCWGDSMLPQIAAIEKCSLVITHGGNNTITESLTYGKPVLVLPSFFDQWDNAQRVQETGYGLRLDPYKFKEPELAFALDFLLNDPQTQQRCMKLAERIATNVRKNELCDWVENLCIKK